jgi:hypothetical protein
MNLPLRLAQSLVPPRLHWLMGLKTSQIHGKAELDDRQGGEPVFRGGQSGAGAGARTTVKRGGEL